MSAALKLFMLQLQEDSTVSIEGKPIVEDNWKSNHSSVTIYVDQRWGSSHNTEKLNATQNRKILGYATSRFATSSRTKENKAPTCPKRRNSNENSTFYASPTESQQSINKKCKEEIINIASSSAEDYFMESIGDLSEVTFEISSQYRAVSKSASSLDIKIGKFNTSSATSLDLRNSVFNNSCDFVEFDEEFSSMTSDVLTWHSASADRKGGHGGRWKNVASEKNIEAPKYSRRQPSCRTLFHAN